jgi:long-subunit fatty acid transport protein
MNWIKKSMLYVLCATSLGVAAQDFNDAYRFSRQELTGTARFIGMSGAFGALGGDLSSLRINPAGSAVFIDNKVAFTIEQNFNGLTTNFGTLSSQTRDVNESNFDLTQAGMVFVYNNNNEQATVNKLTFGISYDRTFNHDARFSAAGETSETIGDYFVDRANGIEVTNFIPNNQSFTGLYGDLGRQFGFAAQEAYLAYETFLIDPLAQDNATYLANVNSNTFTNDMLTRESGLNGQLSFNLGSQLMKKLYLGMNLNFHFVNYDRFSSYLETNNGSGDITEIYYENDLRTRGTGFSFQLGAIYKPIQQVRLGLAYQSPTWFTIEDEIAQGLEIFSQSQNGFVSAFPDSIILFPSYNFRTPGKATFSLAYIIGKSGILSADYSYQDFSNQEFTSTGFQNQNANIDALFQATNNFNLGGEYRYGKISFRGGYHFAESPYTDGLIIGDTNGFSLGLGYNFGNSTLDFAWRRTYLERNDGFVQTGLVNRAFVENTINNLVLSLTFNL